MKIKEDVKGKSSPKEFPEKASMAPQTKPSMKHSEPAHKLEQNAQSMAPDHKKKALSSQDAPAGVKGVNEGASMSLPKSGGVGESEV